MGETERIEEELRHGLRHVAAPQEFTNRVMARVAERGSTREASKASRGLLLTMRRHAGWLAAVAALLIAIGGGEALHVRSQRQAREAAVAQAQIDLAMQLTNHALNEVTTGLDRSRAGRFAQLWDGTEK